MFKVNNKDTRTTLLASFWYFFSYFEHMSYLGLMFLLFILNMWLPAGFVRIFFDKSRIIHFLKRYICNIQETKWLGHVIFTVHDTILQQWMSLLKNFASKKKKSWTLLLKNRAGNSWTIVPVTVERPCQWLLNNRASDCWKIVLVTVKESCQPLLNNNGSDCWTIVLVTVEELSQRLLNNRFPWFDLFGKIPYAINS